MKATAIAALVLAGSTSAPLPVALVSHRAIYDIALDHATGSDFVAAQGRMAVQFKDTCDGWTTAQRLIADMTDSKGLSTRTDFFVTAWESKDGRTMRFDVSDRSNGKVVTRRRGVAALDASGAGRVEYANGSHAAILLPKGTEFPTSQILGILDAAVSGKTTFRHVVFQGGDRSSLNFSTAVIGKAPDAAKLSSDRTADKNDLLRDARGWNALIGFYPLNARAEQPDYEVATRLFLNGISGSMSLIYRTYTLRATLIRLEAVHPSC